MDVTNKKNTYNTGPDAAADFENSSSNTWRISDTQLRETLREQTYPSVLANMVVAGINLIFLWPRFAASFLLGWIVSLAAIQLIRHLLCLESVLARWGILDHPHWHNFFAASISAVGVCWAILGWKVFTELPFEYTLVFVISVAGLVGGSMVTISASYRSLLPFYLLLLLPSSFNLITHENSQAVGTGMLLLFYCVVMLRISRHANRVFVGNIAMREALEASKNKAEQLAADLYKLTTLDALTMVANRRGFDKALKQEWQRAKRTRSSVSLLLIDVDFFKRFNDSLGHIAGDECLQAIAAELSNHARRGGEQIARYGGEEFTIILPDTELHQAEKLGDRLCKAIEALEIVHPDSKIGAFVTVSVGVACLNPTQVSNEEELVLLADKALYEAKAAGRNQVAVSDQQSPALSLAAAQD